jgi:hypothetical protein
MCLPKFPEKLVSPPIFGRVSELSASALGKGVSTSLRISGSGSLRFELMSGGVDVSAAEFGIRKIIQRGNLGLAVFSLNPYSNNV